MQKMEVDGITENGRGHENLGKLFESITVPCLHAQKELFKQGIKER